MTLHFSELLFSLDDLHEKYTKRKLVESFIELEYHGNSYGCSPIEPYLLKWDIIDFDNDKMRLFLNMTNPIYVSSSEEPCDIQFKVKDKYNFAFQSVQTGITVKENYTIHHVMPAMIDHDDTELLMQLNQHSRSSMIFTLIIPFCFMIFMSVSMDRVWSMYLMLQITSNLMNINL